VNIALDPDTAALHQDALYFDAAVPLVNPRLLATYLPDLRQGGVDAILTTVASLEDCRYAVGALADWHHLAHSGQYPVRLATTVADYRQAKQSGELAVGLHFQGGNPIEGDLDLIDVFHALGVRVFQLTYNARNFIGDGCLEDANAGLSTFGRKAIHRLDDRKIAIDISHVGERTSLEAIELASGPVVATHANARTVCDSPRNLTDEQIGAVAASGGVIGLCGFPAFVSPSPIPTLEQLIDHADYISDLVGSQHVGLGLDFAIEDEDDYDYFGYDPRYYPRPPWTWPIGFLPRRAQDHCCAKAPWLHRRRGARHPRRKFPEGLRADLGQLISRLFLSAELAGEWTRATDVRSRGNDARRRAPLRRCLSAR
jgi:membrane dipeptidase